MSEERVPEHSTPDGFPGTRWVGSPRDRAASAYRRWVEDGVGVTEVDPVTGLRRVTVGPHGRDCPSWGSGTVCRNYAGAGTNHPGVGSCREHGGNTRAEKMMAAMIEGHVIAGVPEMSPWDALLYAMRVAAAKAAFFQSKLAETREDDELLPGHNAHEWLRMSDRATAQLARYAKMAVDAGIAERLVQQMELEGALVARVLNAALSPLGLSPEQEALARASLRRELLAIGSQEEQVTRPVLPPIVM